MMDTDLRASPGPQGGKTVRSETTNSWRNKVTLCLLVNLDLEVHLLHERKFCWHGGGPIVTCSCSILCASLLSLVGLAMAYHVNPLCPTYILSSSDFITVVVTLRL